VRHRWKSTEFKPKTLKATALNATRMPTVAIRPPATASMPHI